MAMFMCERHHTETLSVVVVAILFVLTSAESLPKHPNLASNNPSVSCPAGGDPICPCSIPNPYCPALAYIQTFGLDCVCCPLPGFNPGSNSASNMCQRPGPEMNGIQASNYIVQPPQSIQPPPAPSQPNNSGQQPGSQQVIVHNRFPPLPPSGGNFPNLPPMVSLPPRGANGENPVWHYPRSFESGRLPFPPPSPSGDYRMSGGDSFKLPFELPSNIESLLQQKPVEAAAFIVQRRPSADDRASSAIFGSSAASVQRRSAPLAQQTSSNAVEELNQASQPPRYAPSIANIFGQGQSEQQQSGSNQYQLLQQFQTYGRPGEGSITFSTVDGNQQPGQQASLHEQQVRAAFRNALHKRSVAERPRNWRRNRFPRR